MRRAWLRTLSIGWLALAAGCAGSTSEPPEPEPSEAGAAGPIEPAEAVAAVGRPAPDFELARLGRAGSERLSDLRGRVVLLEFWRTWCGPCLRSVPHLNALYAQFAERGLAIVALSNEDEPRLRDTAAAAGMRYPVARVAGGAVDLAYGVTGVPRAVLIDRGGRVLWEGHPAKLTAEQVARALE
jgi:peroxiredoxin